MKTELSKMDLAVNRALDEWQIIRARRGLLGGLDTKRPRAYTEYGFPADIGFDQFFHAFKRGGIANGAVSKLVSKCWENPPEVIEGDPEDNDEDETAWERKNKAVINNPAFWKAFADADGFRLVGKYSGLLLQIADDAPWKDPVIRRNSALVRIIPAYAGDLRIAAYDTAEQSPTYGMPTQWQFTEQSTEGLPGRQLLIHPDRVFILGDYTARAVGFLEPVFNNLINLEKIEGGVGESFLKNASRQLAISFDKEVNLANVASMYGVDLDALKVKFQEAARELNRANDLVLPLQGATATPLTTSVPDPKSPYDVNLQSIAAGLDIPSKILVGMQTGERASTEDQAYFNARCQSRRVNVLQLEICGFIDHLLRLGIVTPVSNYSVVWQDLTSPTKADRLGNSKLMSEINQAAVATGEIPFLASEIRTEAGFDPMDESDQDVLPDDEGQAD